MIDVIQLDDSDAGELLTLQRAAYVTEAQRYHDPDLAPLLQTLDELLAELRLTTTIALGTRRGHRLVGSVRLRVDGQVAHLGRLVVAPDQQGQGIGSALLIAAEHALAPSTAEIRLFTGGDSAATLRLYQRHGYRWHSEQSAGAYTLTHLVKRLDQRLDPVPLS
jgi:ribosomal protein S18 acetylase RimI-like enzyme